MYVHYIKRHIFLYYIYYSFRHINMQYVLMLDYDLLYFYKIYKTSFFLY